MLAHANLSGSELTAEGGEIGVASLSMPRGQIDNVYLVQMGTKPAKVAHCPLRPTKAAEPGLFPVTRKKKKVRREPTKVAKVGPPRVRVDC